jgi:LPS-assembly lipoprotein
MRALILAFSLSLLAACGFQPMYATGAQGGLGPIYVSEVTGKAGHAFRTHFDQLTGVERGAGAARQLDMTLTETIERLGLRVDESSTRADLRLVGAYVLKDVDGAEMFKGQITTIVSYDIPNSAFAEVANQNDARERAGVQMAEQLRAELALRLAQRRAAKK